MSETRIVPASDENCVGEAVSILRRSGLVCYPTDTVYGIGAAAGDDAAVRGLFAVKGRSPDKALPLLLADAGDAASVAEVTPLARTLAGRFWPGALTIVMRKAPDYRSLALAGGETAALRVPDHDVVRAIVALAREPAAVGQVFNIGADEEISILGLAKRVIELTESPSEITFIPYEKAYAKGFEDLARRVPDNTRIRTTIGWRPEHSLDDIIHDVARSLRKGGGSNG